MKERIKRLQHSYQRRRRVILAVLVIFLGSTLLVGQSIFPPDSSTHEAIESAGIVLIFLGIIGRLWAILYIGGRKSQEVVTGGPYSMSRNPLYLFSAVAAIGVGAQMGSILAALGFGFCCALAFHVVIFREEKYLSTIMGQPYQDYLAKVPRFFPRFSLYREGDTGSFKPRLLLHTLLDGLVFLIAMPIFELIDSAQMSGHLPIIFRLP